MLTVTTNNFFFGESKGIFGSPKNGAKSTDRLLDSQDSLITLFLQIIIIPGLAGLQSCMSIAHYYLSGPPTGFDLNSFHPCPASCHGAPLPDLVLPTHSCANSLYKKKRRDRRSNTPLFDIMAVFKHIFNFLFSCAGRL